MTNLLLLPSTTLSTLSCGRSKGFPSRWGEGEAVLVQRKLCRGCHGRLGSFAQETHKRIYVGGAVTIRYSYSSWMDGQTVDWNRKEVDSPPTSSWHVHEVNNNERFLNSNKDDDDVDDHHQQSTDGGEPLRAPGKERKSCNKS